MASRVRQITTDGQPKPNAARDDRWLAGRLEQIWADFFWDVPRPAPVQIGFGGADPDCLGSIRWDPAIQQSRIDLNARFRDPDVPEAVVLATIAHEIAHYARGEGSGLPRRAGADAERAIDRDLAVRGLGGLIETAGRWIEQHWDEG